MALDINVYWNADLQRWIITLTQPDGTYYQEYVDSVFSGTEQDYVKEKIDNLFANISIPEDEQTRALHVIKTLTVGNKAVRFTGTLTSYGSGKLTMTNVHPTVEDE